MSSSDSVNQIKDRLDIVEVISAYVELHKAGRHYKGKSPFSDEKTPSFFISPDRGTYYCFSTNQGGDIFTFIEAMEGVDFKGALKILADKANVQLRPMSPQAHNELDAERTILESATMWFASQYASHKKARTYLNKRTLTRTLVKDWRIGYAPDDWRGLREYLSAGGFSDEQMIRVGLVKRSERKNIEPYDVFRTESSFPSLIIQTDPSLFPVGFSPRRTMYRSTLIHRRQNYFKNRRYCMVTIKPDREYASWISRS